MPQPHALVIGGTRGIGRAVTSIFVREGYRVSAVARNPVAPPDERVRFFAADLGDAPGLERILDAIVADNGPPSYLVFCQRWRGSGDSWAAELEVTLTATRRIVDSLADRFAATGDRAIAAIGSVYGHAVGDGQPAGYHVAKAGLEQLVRHFAVALGSRGIRANVVAPCTLLKRESRHVFEENRPLMDMFEQLVPLGRLGTAEEAAEVIAFLCSPRAGYVTGQTIVVDGGLSLVWPETAVRRFAGL